MQERIQELIEGVKELKMHYARRREFVDKVLQAAETTARRSQFIGDSLNDAAIAWGRLSFFIAIGLLLFVWPRVAEVDAATLTGYSIVILYLMSPLEQIMGWLPFLAWATASVAADRGTGPDAPRREAGARGRRRRSIIGSKSS